MEAIRHSLLAPSFGTFLLTAQLSDAMLMMMNLRSHSEESKDEVTGKPLLPHPYKPWDVPKSEKQKLLFDKNYRAFKMYENVKEWTFMCIPVMWIFAVYGKGMTQNIGLSDTLIDGTIVTTSLIYAIANRFYAKGYIESADKRLPPFKVRKNVALFWLFGSAVSLLYGFLQSLGVV